MLDDDRLVAVNALWTFTHFAVDDNVWLFADPKSPYAIRAQCIKLAYEQMRYWPELLDELTWDEGWQWVISSLKKIAEKYNHEPTED